MNCKKIGTALVILFSLACTKGHDAHSTAEQDVHQVEMQDQGADFKIPSEIWDNITGIDFDQALEKSVALVFVPIKVILHEKNPGVLTYPKIEINMAKGGGEIDISKYTTGRQGTFFVRFEFEGFAQADTFQSYFVSQSKKRKLDNDVVGSGCKFFFDMKNYMLHDNGKEGLKVNTTRQRHVSVLAGHFIFSYLEAKQIFVSRVSFKDSTQSHLMCD